MTHQYRRKLSTRSAGRFLNMSDFEEDIDVDVLCAAKNIKFPHIKGDDAFLAQKSKAPGGFNFLNRIKSSIRRELIS